MWERITSLVNITLIEPCLFESLALVYMLNPVSDWRSAKEVLYYILKSVIVWVVYAFLLALFLVLFSYVDADTGLLFAYLPVILVYIAATLILGRNHENGMGLVTVITTLAAANIMIEAGLSYAGRIIETASSLVWPGYLLSLLLKPVFYIAAAIYLTRFNVEKYDRMPASGMAAFWITEIILIVGAIVANGRDPSPDYIGMLAFTNVVSFVLSILIYTIMYIMCGHYERTLLLSQENAITQAQNTELKMRERNEEEIRKIRHDIKNQYAYMDYLVSEKRYDDLVAYFAGMQEQLKATGKYLDVGNVKVNSMLNMEMDKAANAGFTIEADVTIPPELGIEELDLSTLLINLLDNAIEANVRYMLKDPVKITMNVKNDFLFITVENKLREGVDKERVLSLKSSKASGARTGTHGLGHGIVEKICLKHDGACEYKIEGNVFMANAVLMLDTEEKR